MYKLKRKIILILLTFCSVLPSVASDHIKVTNAHDEAVYFAIDEQPTVTFTASSLVITTIKSTIEYPIAEYRAFTFEEPTTNDITSTTYEPVFNIGSSLVAEGLQPGSAVSVCDVSGLVIGRAKASNDGKVEIPLNNQKGIFIVKTTSRTFKFIKR